MSERMKTACILANYEDGDGRGWPVEFEWIRENHPANIRKLTYSILQHGIKTPILLGNDGRVWDGHHRLYVAHHMGLEHVNVEHARSNND